MLRDEGQPQASAVAVGAGVGGTAAYEAVEDALLVLDGHPRASVVDLDDPDRAALRQVHGDRSAAVPVTVVEQVHQQLHGFFGLILMQSTTVIAPEWYTGVHPAWASSLLADQKRDAGIAWAFGEIPASIVMIVLAHQWIRADQREQVRLDRAADRADATGRRTISPATTRFCAPPQWNR